MKTNNTIWSRWIRRVSQLMAVLMITMSFAGQASALILFQDDSAHDINSEGITINADDGGDEDVTFQFGNDGTDATIIFDDGTGDVTFATDGGDFSFSDDNITTTGTTSTGGLTSTGVIDFSGATSMSLVQGASNPGTCTEGMQFYNTTDNNTYVCTATNTWTALSASSQDFESVYGTDGDNTLTTGGGAFTINTGANDFIVTSNDWSVNAAGALTATSLSDGTATLTGGSLNGLTGTDATTENTIEATIFDADAQDITGVWEVQDDTAFQFGTDGDVLIQYDELTDNRLEITGLNANVYIEDSLTVDTNTTVNGTLDANGTVTLGDGGDTVTISSSDWAITSAGDMTGIGAITADGLITGSAGATLSGAAVSLNNNSNFAVNVATGTSTGAVSIGGGSNTVAIDSTSWDVSTAGLITGLTGITSTGVIDFSGASRMALHQGAANPGTCAEGDIFYNTTDNLTYVCTATNTFTSLSSGAQDFESIYGADAGNDLLVTDNVAAAFTIGEGANDYITIVTTNAAEAVQIDQTLIVNQALNANGVVTIGDGGDDVAINSDDWDISSGGAASGFTTFDASGNFTTSAGDFVIGTTGLTETNGSGDNGATLIGVDQTEFDNSSSTNVQDVLDDIDALIGSNAPNVDTLVWEPEYPNYILFGDGTTNNGKMEALYDSTNREQYFRWTTKKSVDHDYDIRFRYTLPADFSGNGDLTLRLRNDTNVGGDNSVAIIVRNDTDNLTCHTDGAVTASAANTWETVTVTGAEIGIGCATNNPGDVIEVQMKLLADNTSSGGTDVGTLAFAYTN